jgi:hypothetical protein
MPSLVNLTAQRVACEAPFAVEKILKLMVELVAIDPLAVNLPRSTRYGQLKAMARQSRCRLYEEVEE